MKYPCQWIVDDIPQPSNPHPHWWREIKTSGRTSLGAHIVQEGHNNPADQHFALWQVAAFRLPVAQHGASGWWDTPPTLCGLHPQDFLPPTTASDPQDIWVMRQEKTLALAQALQACTEASGAKTGILCEAAREQQQCMAPLMTLSGDDIVEASLLRPTGEELRPSPTPEEETALLGEEDGPSGVPGPTPRHSEIPRLVEPAEQTTPPVTSTVFHSHPSWKGKKLWEGIDIDLNKPGKWIQAYLERDSRLPEWWKEFHPLVHSTDGHCDDTKVKSLTCQQAAAFHLSATQKEVHIVVITPSCLAVLGKKGYLVPKDAGITWDYWEVWREETVVLAIVFQRCVIHAGASPYVFCRAVQELCKCLIPMVEEGNLFNMETQIWEGVRKDPMAPTSSKRAPSLMPRVEEPTSTPAPNPPLVSEPEGAASPEELALGAKKVAAATPRFSLGWDYPKNTTSGRCVWTWGYAHGNPV